MANKVTVNYTLDTGVSNNSFSAIWKLTRMMKAAGWTYLSSSDGTTKDTTGTATNDKWGGAVDPTTDSYPTAFNGISGPWIDLQGPQTVKVPITVASSGTFTRGEQVSQATSAATGELLGYVFDATNAGWVVILPRTGTFDGTHLITGAISAATVTPSATPRFFNQEVVFWKSNTNGQNGEVYYSCFDNSSETAQSFNSLTGAAGCTATTAPGGGGTGNGFPSKAIAIRGTGGSNTNNEWVLGSSTMGAHATVSALNATPASNVSADGTWWIAVSNTTATNANGWFYFTGFFRLDDSEPGDVNPFAFYWPQSTSTGSYSRTAAPGNPGVPGFVGGQTGFTAGYTTDGVTWNGYIARGTGFATDVASFFKTTQEAVTPATYHTGYIAMQGSNQASLIQVQNHPATVKPSAVLSPMLINDVTNQQMIKGRPRWIRVASFGNAFDTFDTITWLCLFTNTGNGVTNNIAGAILVGPLDGTTVPTT